jgi:putative inorganic carbon (hco3(-)) transporter
MRDLVLGVLFLYGPLVALVNPAGGILFWTWVSIMSPHKLSWRFGDKPVAFALALAILIGVVFTKRRRFLVTKETVAFTLFVIWILAVAYPFSMHFEQSFVMWDKVWRVDLMIMIA